MNPHPLFDATMAFSTAWDRAAEALLYGVRTGDYRPYDAAKADMDRARGVVPSLIEMCEGRLSS